MESWELVARESVRDLVARYNANGDSGRFDEMRQAALSKKFDWTGPAARYRSLYKAA